MGVLADWQIKQDIQIEPFAESAASPGSISFGVSSYGYDVRVGRHFKVFTNVYCAVVDPKNFDPTSFVDIEGDYCIIPPNSFALAETVEYFEIPRDVLAVCVGKIDVCSLRHHRERDAAGARMARQDDDRDQQHDAVAREDLRQRGHRADSVLPRRRTSARRATPTRRASTRIKKG